MEHFDGFTITILIVAIPFCLILSLISIMVWSVDTLNIESLASLLGVNFIIWLPPAIIGYLGMEKNQ